MKRIITLAFALFCLLSAFAADFDIIIKTNSEKIEALIQEVSDTEIKYKKASNPNGPLFVVKLDEVATILYANGDVQAIESTTNQPAPAVQQQSNYGYNFNMISSGQMIRTGSNEFMIDGKTLTGKELKYFLEQNCPVAYKHYKKNLNIEIAGSCMLGAGAIMVGVGTPFFLYWVNRNRNSSTDEAHKHRPDKYGSAVAMVLGAAMVAASIPMIACGDVYRKRTDQVYNASCAKAQAFQPELHLTSGPNGLGLALHF